MQNHEVVIISTIAVLAAACAVTVVDQVIRIIQSNNQGEK